MPALASPPPCPPSPAHIRCRRRTTLGRGALAQHTYYTTRTAQAESVAVTEGHPARAAFAAKIAAVDIVWVVAVRLVPSESVTFKCARPAASSMPRTAPAIGARPGAPMRCIVCAPELNVEGPASRILATIRPVFLLMNTASGIASHS
eukprot:7273443-Prymnesium_polylepis.1